MQSVVAVEAEEEVGRALELPQLGEVAAAGLHPPVCAEDRALRETAGVGTFRTRFGLAGGAGVSRPPQIRVERSR